MLFPGVLILAPSSRALHLSQPDPDLPLPSLTLRLSRYSKSAAKAILAAGGDITAVYHNNLSLRKVAYPEKYMGREIKDAEPVRKTDIQYYTNPLKFGYLAKRKAVNASSSTVSDGA